MLVQATPGTHRDRASAAIDLQVYDATLHRREVLPVLDGLEGSIHRPHGESTEVKKALLMQLKMTPTGC